jgi:hypothetical protein
MKTIFKSFLIAGLLTSFSIAQAQEIKTPVGSFVFQGRVELLSAKKSELISLLNQAGHDRVIELKKLGWTCLQKAGNFNQCTLFAKNESIPFALMNQIQKKYNSMNFVFGQVDSVELVNDAEFLKEFDVHQQITLNSQSTDKYKMQLLKDGPTKIQIAFSEAEKVYLNVTDENSIAGVESMTVSKKNTSTLYFIQINFDKE